jgi:hypothetical protein
MVAVEVQLFASVTVTVYEPTGIPVSGFEVLPPGDHAYEYPGVPPVSDTAMAPLLSPRQETRVTESKIAI